MTPQGAQRFDARTLASSGFNRNDLKRDSKIENNNRSYDYPIKGCRARSFYVKGVPQ